MVNLTEENVISMSNPNVNMSQVCQSCLCPCHARSAKKEMQDSFCQTEDLLLQMFLTSTPFLNQREIVSTFKDERTVNGGSEGVRNHSSSTATKTRDNVTDKSLQYISSSIKPVEDLLTQTAKLFETNSSSLLTDVTGDISVTLSSYDKDVDSRIRSVSPQDCNDKSTENGERISRTGRHKGKHNLYKNKDATLFVKPPIDKSSRADLDIISSQSQGRNTVNPTFINELNKLRTATGFVRYVKLFFLKT